jgi:hypothetical protein
MLEDLARIAVVSAQSGDKSTAEYNAGRGSPGRSRIGRLSAEAGQEFYYGGRPARVFFAPMLTTQRSLRFGARKPTPGGAKKRL